jgi:hypothetical protein
MNAFYRLKTDEVTAQLKLRELNIRSYETENPVELAEIKKEQQELESALSDIRLKLYVKCEV